jgi:hypothetical protein
MTATGSWIWSFTDRLFVFCAINVPYALSRYALSQAFSIPRQECFRAGIVCGKWLIRK